MKHFKSKYQKGVTLFEILLVLFVAAAITVTVAVGARRTTEAAKQKQMLEDVSELVGNIRQLYSTKDDYTGISNTVVLAAKLAPEDMITKDNKPTHVYTTSVNVWSIEAGDTPNEFKMVITELPTKACVFLGMQGLDFANKVEFDGKAATNLSAITNACNAGKALTLTFD